MLAARIRENENQTLEKFWLRQSKTNTAHASARISGNAQNEATKAFLHLAKALKYFFGTKKI